MPEAVDALRAISQVISATENTDLVMKLYQARDEIMRLQDENRAMQGKIVSLTEELRRRKALEYRDGAYYVTIEGGRLEGPVCRACYARDGLINRLKWNGHHELWCTVCDVAYNPNDLEEYEPPPGVTFV